jgi:hypothetical protein
MPAKGVDRVSVSREILSKGGRQFQKGPSMTYRPVVAKRSVYSIAFATVGSLKWLPGKFLGSFKFFFSRASLLRDLLVPDNYFLSWPACHSAN